MRDPALVAGTRPTSVVRAVGWLFLAGIPMGLAGLVFSVPVVVTLAVPAMPALDASNLAFYLPFLAIQSLLVVPLSMLIARAFSYRLAWATWWATAVTAAIGVLAGIVRLFGVPTDWTYSSSAGFTGVDPGPDGWRYALVMLVANTFTAVGLTVYTLYRQRHDSDTLEDAGVPIEQAPPAVSALERID